MSSFFIKGFVLLLICLPIVHSEYFGKWGSWSSCKTKEPCGYGKHSRFRCYWFYGKCFPIKQSSYCKVPCDGVDGKWSVWSSWGSCSVSCGGGGTQSRSRTCTNPPPSNGGADCVGDRSQTRPCATQTCQPGWSVWGAWTTCPVTCGGGSQSRTRTCTNPPPVSGGPDCKGDGSETQRCATTPCERPGWSVWGAWTTCPVTCGGGSQSRTRTCTNPPPVSGGPGCKGDGSETQRCATTPCDCRQAGQTVFDSCGQRCICGAGGTLTQCTRIRKEFTSMTTAERQRYIRVVKTASTDVRYKSRYNTLITLHKTIFFNNGIHDRQHFLTWHRWYILEYENLLREIDCHFTVAYWDWSVVSGNPWRTTASDLWYDGDSGFGGDGTTQQNCVTTGPFRERIWELVPSAPRPRCLKRGFFGRTPDSVAVTQVTDIPASRFDDFEVALRVNLHDTVHCLIGQTMCATDSASAPEFFLHHGMIDKIWTDWQRKSNSHRAVFFPSVRANLPGTGGLRPSQFIDNAALPGGVRVEYLPTGNSQVSNVLSRLRAASPGKLKKVPRERFNSVSERALELFKVSKADREKAKKMDDELQPEKEASVPAQAPAMDKDLGFDHTVV